MHRTVTTTLSKLSNTLNTNGVIPFFYHQDIDRVLEVMKILKRCGCNVFEFTHQRDARGIRMFTWLAEKAKELDIIIGAGTVLDASQANRFIEAGAHFIASPFLHADVARVCHENNVVWIPGCSTFQDVAEAKALQASLVTILPGNILGPAFLKQVVNVHPEMSFIPSGGVTLVKNNLQGWFDAGALCVRLGESLFTREDVAVKDWVKVEGNVYRALQGIKQIKTSILRTKSITISE
jgi:2-dehydro-3-deoxyphosphogluconate aldolase/(4S)-4-hydroxy-2-oxoglutarate aldolase